MSADTLAAYGGMGRQIRDKGANALPTDGRGRHSESAYLGGSRFAFA